MPQTTLKRLKSVADGLIRRMEKMPRTDATFGPWLKTRLADEDWIKSLDLFNFTKPLDVDPEPLWKPDQDVLAHIDKQLAIFPPGATSLDALEFNLKAFNDHAIGGIENWFTEVGGETGYWLDKRVHSLASEMAAIASMFEWSAVSKLRRLKKSAVPDYLIDLGPLTLVAETKTLFGRAWPLVVLRTIIRALSNLAGMREAKSVMIIALDPDVATNKVENELARLSIKDMIAAIHDVVRTGRDEPITPSLVAVPRTEAARSLKLHASYLTINTRADFDLEFADWTPSIASIKNEALRAWEQCESWHDLSQADLRLDVAAINAEAWPGHPELSRNQQLLQQWLQEEVWSTHPNRALKANFSDIFHPVWYVSAAAREKLDRIPDATAKTED